MPISINPALISGAMTAQSPVSSVPLKLCGLPKEGTKCLPMQFKFGPQKVWLVNIAIGQTTQALSQICSMYMDATQCSRPITVLFPDTGYQVTVGAGDSKLVPVLTNATPPLFYVISDSNNSFSTADIFELFLLNIFVPEFSSDTFIDSIMFGLNKNVSGNIEQVVRTVPGAASHDLSVGGSLIYVKNVGGLIRGMQIFMDVLSTVAAQIYELDITGQNTGTSYFKLPFKGTNAEQVLSLLSVAGFDLDPDDNSVRADVTPIANITTMTGFFNIQGNGLVF